MRSMGVLFVIAIFIVPGLAVVTAISSEGAEEFTPYYDQLNVNEKAAYDAINSAGFDTRTITVVLPITLTARSDNPDDAKEYLEKEIRSISDNAFIALWISSPYAYWGWIANVVPQPTPDLTQNGDQFTVTSLTWTIEPAHPPGTQNAGEVDVEKMVDDLKAAVDLFHTDSTTIRGKVLDMNNYLVDLVTYDPNARVYMSTNGEPMESPFAHDAYGALVDPSHYAVCDGYSKAFLLLCQKEGIDCVVVFGTKIPDYENHAWNYVKMDDDKWYAVDVTWNDNGKGDNPYFLMGGDTFFATHNQGVFLGVGTKSYTFDSPVISGEDYDVAPATSGYNEQLSWIAAAAIVIIIAIMLYRYSKENK